jgi:ABC-2 type transport system ATP-binding protein
VRVRAPELARLRAALEQEGATTVVEDDGSLSVRGTGEVEIGELAARSGFVLHELAPQSASLEEAFIESTEGNLEFHGDRPSNHTGVSQA